MTITIDHRWRVLAREHIDLPVRASAVWGQMRDLHRFLTIDPLHVRVRITASALSSPAGSNRRDGSPPRTPTTPPGTQLIISHRLLGLGPDRVGRVLTWNEGRGYAVSDMSRRGPRAGFPHVCIYEVAPIDDTASRLTVTARGLWTARWMPRWLIRAWLWWVMKATGARLIREFETYSRWHARNRRPCP